MRDTNRIDNFLTKFGEYWKKVPDWRFGQLFCNLPFKTDPFFLEEDEFLQCMEEFFNGQNII